MLKNEHVKFEEARERKSTITNSHDVTGHS
jgi:hypothetical protein